jgi:hypothetical protein
MFLLKSSGWRSKINQVLTEPTRLHTRSPYLWGAVSFYIYQISKAVRIMVRHEQNHIDFSFYIDLLFWIIRDSTARVTLADVSS